MVEHSSLISGYMTDQLVDSWIAEHKDYRTERRPTVGWAFKELNRLCQEEPFAALRAIDQIITKDHSDPIMEVLAAGPLENVLVIHGTIIVDEIRKLAETNQAFRELMGGVWSAGIDPKVWEQVKDLRSAPW
jgi:hypothetical protein